MPKFVNLHTHSHYSLLDGLPKIPELVARAKEVGMPALALTDHGVMYGAVDFYKECTKAGIKPIIGVEAYLALEHRSRKQSKLDDDYYHLILLAETNEGYKNLMKLTSLAHLEGFYYKPRLDKESLKAHSKGIIALTACLGGEVARSILDNKPLEETKKIVEEYQSIFGENNVFLEVQHHPEIPEQQKVNDALKELSKITGVPRVATLDNHYLYPDDAEAQDVLVCVSTGKNVSDADRLDMRTVDLSLKSPEEVTAMFPGEPEIVEQSVKIAERCNADIEIGKRYFPVFEIPDSKNPEDYLREQVEKGAREKFKSLTPQIQERIDYELKVINDKGYPTYFLIVADFVNWMRGRNIITTTRGSAAGSLVSYCLGITNVEPLTWLLPFERFLNPYRPTAPDIDVDIADNRRNEVIDYVTQKYGQEKVAQIITFGTMLARAAVRDVGRVLGIPYAKCDQLAKLIPPPKQGFPMPIRKALETVPELKEIYEKDPEAQKILDLVKKVEGVARHSSVHAAGVVISPTPLVEYTPVQHDVDGNGMVTQYHMNACEDVGLVKMDFLGIRNLSILGNAVEIIRAKHKVEIDLDNLPLDDKKTFELLAEGDTVGVFQLGGSGMTAYLKELKPTSIFDIAAMIALYRPGPMESIPEYIRRKHNPRLVKYLDPRMEKFLDKSYGLIVYQDDLLFCALELAGYNWEEADKFRKAVGKKIPAEMAAQKEKFTKGIVQNGQTQEFADKLWKLFEPFQAYGFNKAHAASYAMVTYQTAYLKANYPAEFMAAVLTAESADLEKIAAAVEECKKMGIQVLPPDVNESFKMFAVMGDKTIRWALTAVKNVGDDVVAEIIRERKANGPYTSFQNLVSRLPSKSLNRKGIESLIRCGAFDSMAERNLLLTNMEDLLEAARASRKNVVEGQSSLFIGTPKAVAANPAANYHLAPADPADQAQKLEWEKELLGLYVTSHPLEEFKDQMDGVTQLREASKMSEGNPVTVAGILSHVKKITTKKGEPMAFLTIEDLTGSLEAICFPRTYTQNMALIDSKGKVVIVGKISDKDGQIKIIIDEIKPLTSETLNSSRMVKPKPMKPVYYTEADEAPAAPSEKIVVNIPANASQNIFGDLKATFEGFPGETRVVLNIPDSSGRGRQVVTNYRVKLDPALREAIRKILVSYNGN